MARHLKRKIHAVVYHVVFGLARHFKDINHGISTTMDDASALAFARETWAMYGVGVVTVVLR